MNKLGITPQIRGKRAFELFSAMQLFGVKRLLTGRVNEAGKSGKRGAKPSREAGKFSAKIKLDRIFHMDRLITAGFYPAI